MNKDSDLYFCATAMFQALCYLHMVYFNIFILKTTLKIDNIISGNVMREFE